MNLFEKWFPASPRPNLAARLQEFYDSRDDYHEMTALADSRDNPHVRLLECLVQPGGKYLEVGCGDGQVCKQIASVARVVGIDGSEIAIQRSMNGAVNIERTEFLVASAYDIPLESASADGAYSFEVFEHLLDPVAAAREMARVLRPGGFMLLSAPNRFSLDAHLPKHPAARMADYLMAGCRWSLDRLRRRPFVLLEPDLAGEVYPDCDAVANLVPPYFCRELELMGMETVFWDSAYMYSQRFPEKAGLSFQRRLSSPCLKNWGDHFLMLFRKQ